MQQIGDGTTVITVVHGFSIFSTVVKISPIKDFNKAKNDNKTYFN